MRQARRRSCSPCCQPALREPGCRTLLKIARAVVGLDRTGMPSCPGAANETSPPAPAPFSRVVLMTKRPLPEPLSRLRRRWPAVALLLLRNADGGPLCNSFVHLLGGEQRPDRHASKPRGICTQLGGCCGDFLGVGYSR